MKWHYTAEEIRIPEKWNPKRQAEELAAFNRRLNRLGSEGWEMVSYQPVPLTGSIMTDKVKGYVYLAIFKRPDEAQ